MYIIYIYIYIYNRFMYINVTSGARFVALHRITSSYKSHR